MTRLHSSPVAAAASSDGAQPSFSSSHTFEADIKRKPIPRKTATTAAKSAKPKTKRPSLKPTDIYVAEPDAFDPQAARRALVIVCDDAMLSEQIRREMRIEPMASKSIKVIEAAARVKRARMNGRICAVVPNYNYAGFIAHALDSLINQTRPPDQIIIVDDASTDDSVARAAIWIHEHDAAHMVRIVQHERNTGNVGGPRNSGILATDAEFIITLDSDDMLEPEYIETLYAAIKDDHAIGVVYSGVQTHNEADGKRTIHHEWPIPFNWAWMSSGKEARTCIPTASMFRREMWERAGGYDAGRTAAEDAEFWLRALGSGFEALKATSAPLFIYRRHGDSMSRRKIQPLQTWSIGHRGHTPIAAPTGVTPAPRNYIEPSISVIIPVGPGHADKLPTAIHSVVSQTFTNWELVIVNDSGADLPLAPYPFVKLISTRGREGAGAARNAGMKAAHGRAAFFLDADDFIMPRALEMMAKRYAQGDAGYVFSGWWKIAADGDGQPREIIPDTYQPMIYNHPVSVLIAVEDALRIGGFDESMTAFEDWEFFVRCGIAGLCGARVPEALLGYRMATGERRAKGLAMQAEIAEFIKREHGEYIDGRKQIMACCGGNAQAAQVLEADANRRVLPTFETDGSVLMKFVGQYVAPVTYFGKYSGCKDCPPVHAEPSDMQRLQDTGVWVLVKDDMPSIPQPAMIYAEGNINA